MYVNAPGGIDLYSTETFMEQGIALRFLQSKPLVYPQYGNAFVPQLSIIDVLMFNPLKLVQSYIEANYLICEKSHFLNASSSA
jgi:hypothetical protein